MLQEIVIKKRLLIGNLINQKRCSSHPLNKSYNLAKSVYQVLFWNILFVFFLYKILILIKYIIFNIIPKMSEGYMGVQGAI